MPQDGAHTRRMKNLTYFAVYVMFDMGGEGRRVYGTSSPEIETCQDPPNTGLRQRTRMGNPSQLRNFSAAHIRTMTYAGKHRDRVCGADVHKDLIVATITGRDETKISASFGTSPPELGAIQGIVANPWQIKTIPNDKSDAKDADRISDLCMNGQINRSRVFCQKDQDLRTLTRMRYAYVKMRTQLKNRVHKHLSSNGIKLSSSVVDIF